VRWAAHSKPINRGPNRFRWSANINLCLHQPLSCSRRSGEEESGAGKAVTAVGVGAKAMKAWLAYPNNRPIRIANSQPGFVRGVILPAALEEQGGQFVLGTAESGAAASTVVPLSRLAPRR